MSTDKRTDKENVEQEINMIETQFWKSPSFLMPPGTNSTDEEETFIATSS